MTLDHYPPRRIQRRRTKGWRAPDGVVNVCRPCDWGNPFKVGETVLVPEVEGYGDPIAILEITPALAVALFEAWVLEHNFVEQIKSELHDKDLMCWCKLSEPCHADVLLRMANAPLRIYVQPDPQHAGSALDV